jgi:hypothetical protein
MDGYTFAILPSVRQLVKSWSPNFKPANAIFVAYDLQSEYKYNYGIYTALLGIESQNDLIDKVDEIQFVESKTGNVLHSCMVIA